MTTPMRTTYYVLAENDASVADSPSLDEAIKLARKYGGSIVELKPTGEFRRINVEEV
jgi:hypothetical protein